MNSKFLIGVIAIIALGVFGVAFLERPATPAPNGTGVTQNQTDTVGETGTTTQVATTTIGAGSTSGTSKPTYTLADVAKHNSGTSCWVAIHGNVYDLTNWIGQHPGGPQRILNICGTDATAAFTAQHGGQARPAAELASFYLAPLGK
jgi:cytochrome b involved in lipid metabolism